MLKYVLCSRLISEVNFFAAKFLKSLTVPLYIIHLQEEVLGWPIF